MVKGKRKDCRNNKDSNKKSKSDKDKDEDKDKDTVKRTEGA